MKTKIKLFCIYEYAKKVNFQLIMINLRDLVLALKGIYLEKKKMEPFEYLIMIINNNKYLMQKAYYQ